MNLLETKDLLELSLLKCKVCEARLQSPVLQVGVFGNVCGGCYDRDVFTGDIIRNVDLEALLQKLYLPCNLAARGCNFEGSFDDVCKHEKQCSFRRKGCPLPYYEQCKNDLIYIDDIITHMKSVHPDNVLRVEDHVSVKNPIDSNQDVFYVLEMNNVDLLLRARLDVDKGHVLYAFYCFNYDFDIERIKVSIVLKYENTFCNVENIHINTLDRGDLPDRFIEEEATKLKLATLENFECLDSIVIKVNIQKNMRTGQLSGELGSTPSLYNKCANCLKLSKNVYYCFEMNAISCCDNCCPEIFAICKCGNKFHNSEHKLVKLGEIKPMPIFACQNTGCNEEITLDKYYSHTRWRCKFVQTISCPLSVSTFCNWTGAPTDLTAHIKTDHSDCINQHSCELPSSNGTLRQLCFIKGNNIFMQTYQITKNQLSITTKNLNIRSNYCDDYMWQIYFKHPVKRYETVISDIFTYCERKKSIDIAEFSSSGTFTFKVLLRWIDTFSNGKL